jgi:hypothetical protein
MRGSEIGGQGSEEQGIVVWGQGSGTKVLSQKTIGCYSYNLEFGGNYLIFFFDVVAGGYLNDY